MPASVREDICKSAVRLARAAKYTSAGTCEFLVDKDFRFYFIEANTRIQVEHPVSELVTGIDLLRAQIGVAAGEKIPFTQQQIEVRGCALECRINAEDPEHGFRPSPGTVQTWIPPGGFGVRVDTHVCAGYRVPPNYDSLIAKLLIYQPTRAEAIACGRRALDEFTVEGIRTTIPLHRRLLRDTAFIEGGVDTKYLERSYFGAGSE